MPAAFHRTCCTRPYILCLGPHLSTVRWTLRSALPGPPTTALSSWVRWLGRGGEPARCHPLPEPIVLVLTSIAWTALRRCCSPSGPPEAADD